MLSQIRGMGWRYDKEFKVKMKEYRRRLKNYARGEIYMASISITKSDGHI